MTIREQLRNLQEGVHQMTIKTKSHDETFDLEVSNSEGYKTFAIFNERCPLYFFIEFQSYIRVKIITQFLEFKTESFVRISYKDITVTAI